jgi:uncharacterized Rmd1/YagE family protein
VLDITKARQTKTINQRLNLLSRFVIFDKQRQNAESLNKNVMKNLKILLLVLIGVILFVACEKTTDTAEPEKPVVVVDPL